MKNLLMRFWVKVRLAVIILLSIVIGVSYTIAIPKYLELEREANGAYEKAVKIREQRIENKKDDGDAVSAATQVKPIEDKGETKNSPAPLGDILPKIYQLESSSGKNDSCKQKGKFNGYGFMQSTFYWECFDSKEEVEKKVAGWFEEKLQTYTLAESVCLYNTGRATSDCPYYQKFKTI